METVFRPLIIFRIWAKKRFTMGGKKDRKALEKLMSYILDRRPDEFGLVLDGQGAVCLKDLLKAISEEPGWGYVRKSHIHEVLIAACEKSFVLENDKIKARCRNDALNPKEGVVPPKLLYHCVRRKAYPVICKQGLIPLGQPQVVLATTEALAQRMGKRRDPAPVLLTVQAQRAFGAGVRFLNHRECIYTTDHVPVGYFTGPPLPKEKKKEGPKPKNGALAVPEDRPGSFAFDVERSQALQQQRLKQKGLKKEIAWKKDVRRSRRKGKR